MQLREEWQNAAPFFVCGPEFCLDNAARKLQEQPRATLDRVGRVWRVSFPRAIDNNVNMQI